MIQTVLQNLVVTVGTVMLTTHPTTLPQTPITVADSRVHMVRAGESLSQIAQDNYDNKDAWTAILKDNPQVKNPDVLEEGTILKLKIATPSAEEIKNSIQTPMHDSIAVEATPAITTAPTATQPATATYTGGPLTEEQLTFLGTCEAGMNPTRNSGNGYYGAFQFSYGTWKSMETGYERADMAPLEVQKAAVQKLLSRSSIFHQFPGCAKKMRSLGII